MSEHHYTSAERLDQLARFEQGCREIAALLTRHGQSSESFDSLAVEARRLRREGFRPAELSELARSVPPVGRHPRALDLGAGEPWELQLAELGNRLGSVLAELRARGEWR